MQRLFEWSERPTWEIRGTGLTGYIGTCKGCLNNQNIPFEKSEALYSQAMLEHTKVVWMIRTSLLRNQRHWTHILIGTCKGCLSDQNILPKKSEALDSHPMLGHAKVVWVNRISLPRNQRHWTYTLCWNIQRLFEWSGHFSWEIRGTRLTHYVGTCKGCLGDQNIPSEKSQALGSHSMLEHAKIVWVIRTSLLKNQRHQTHSLCWGCLSDQDISLRNQRHWTHKLC